MPLYWLIVPLMDFGFKRKLAETEQNIGGAGTSEEIHPVLPARDISGWETEIGETQSNSVVAE